MLFGQEKDGLTRRALAAAHHRIRIPMEGMVASLNVSVAAALIATGCARETAAPRVERVAKPGETRERPQKSQRHRGDDVHQNLFVTLPIPGTQASFFGSFRLCCERFRDCF